MGPTVRRLALLAAFAAVAGTAATAQDKKPPVPIPLKKDDPKAKEKVAPGSVEITQDKRDGYRFKIVAADGKVLAMCTKGYARREEAVEALEEVKAILATAKVAEVSKPAEKK